MEYEIRNWLYFTWLSGDFINEQAVHSLDKTAWVQGDVHPLKATGIGGRQQRIDPQYGNVYDHFTVFYEYPEERRVYFTCRQQEGCSTMVDELVIGTKGRAWLLKNQIEGENAWQYKGPPANMYDLEHAALFQSIRDGKPINNGHYMANSTMLAIMGRMSAYTGQTLTLGSVLQRRNSARPQRLWLDRQRTSEQSGDSRQGLTSSLGLVANDHEAAANHRDIRSNLGLAIKRIGFPPTHRGFQSFFDRRGDNYIHVSIP